MAPHNARESRRADVDDVAGPNGYTIPFEADVTVILYVNTNVRANHVFREGELNAKGIERVLADLPKILADGK